MLSARDLYTKKTCDVILISIYKRLISVYFKFICIINNKFVNATLFNITRLISFLDLSRLSIKICT